jgi:hypothetical protein
MSQARIEQTDHGYQFVKDEFHIELTEDDLATLSKSANHILSLILQQNSRLSSGLRAVSALETQSVTIGRDTDQIFLTFHSDPDEFSCALSRQLAADVCERTQQLLRQMSDETPRH